MKYMNIKKVAIWEISGAITTMAATFFFHNLYQLSGYNKIIAAISPVNESIWEHTKIVVIPYLLFSIIEWIFIKPAGSGFIFAKAVGSFSILFFMISFYYTYSGIFGDNLLIIDIISALVWTVFSYIISFKIIKNSKKYKKLWFIGIVILATIILGEVVFTYYPPEIPLFLGVQTGSYGIN